MVNLSRVSFDVEQSARENLMVQAQIRFSAVHEFIKGDLTQDIYGDLIHNENNMRPSQLNSLFKVAGLGDVCAQVSNKCGMLAFFGETDGAKAHGKFLSALENFFERRNTIAHSLDRAQSSGAGQIITDLNMLRAFSEGLLQTLDTLNASPP
jgi:hypothetical protein